MDILTVFKKVITDSSMPWVLFKNGTCVMLLHPESDARAQAVALLKDHGMVIAGTPSGDFEVTKIPEIHGWIVTGDYPGIMVYVSEEEAVKTITEVEVGMIGRTKRERDAHELYVVYVEDKHATK